jgi:hypothetical protein
MLKFRLIATKSAAMAPAPTLTLAPAAATTMSGRGKQKARDLDVVRWRGFFLHHGGGDDHDVV